MCDTCGCGQPGNKVTIRKPGEDLSKDKVHHNIHDKHNHDHSHPHSHDDHDHSVKTELELSQDILFKNNLLAERNEKLERLSFPIVIRTYNLSFIQLISRQIINIIM